MQQKPEPIDTTKLSLTDETQFIDGRHDIFDLLVPSSNAEES